MAVEVFSLYSKLGLDSSSFEKGLETAEKGFHALGNLAKTTSIAITAVSGAISAVAGKSIQASTEYETAFAKVKTIMDDTQVSAEDMSSAILDLSSKMGIASSDISDTVYNAISATGDTANAVSLVESATKLATAGFTDSSSALSVLTTTMNAYGMSVEDATHISDSLITVQNLGVTTVGELASAMGKAIATASAYGVDLENLESSYISLTKAGISTQEGTTYLSSMLKELGDSGSDVSKILQEKTGKSFDQLMAQGYSLGDILGVLQDSVDGDATALMNLWGSAEAGKASNAILSQSVESFNSNLATLRDSVGTTEDAFNVMADTIEHKVSIFKTVGQNLLINIGNGLAEASTGLVDFGVDSMELLATAMQEGGIPKLIETAGVVMSNFINQIVAVAPVLIDSASVLLSALLQGINDNIDSVLDGAYNIIVTLVKGIVSFLPQLKNVAYNILAYLINGIGEGLPKLVGNIPNIIGWLINNWAGLFSDLLTFATAILAKIAVGITEGIPEFIKNLPNLGKSLYEGFGNVLGTMYALGKEIISRLWEGIKAGWNWLKTKGGKLFNMLFGNEKIDVGQSISSGWTDFVNDLTETTGNAFLSAIDKTEEMIDNFAKTTEKKLDDVITTVDENINQIEPKDIEIKIGIDSSELIPAMETTAIVIDTIEAKTGEVTLTTDEALNRLNTFMESTMTSWDGLSDDAKLKINSMYELLKKQMVDSDEVNETVVANAIKRLDDYVASVNFAGEALEGFKDIGIDTFESLMAGFEDLGYQLVTGENTWQDWGLSALEMLAEILTQIGAMLAGLAVQQALMGRWDKFAMATAGSVASFTAGGILKGTIANIKANREEQEANVDEVEYREDRGYQSGYDDGYDEGFEEGKKQVTVVQNIQTVPLSAYELEQQAYVMADKLRWA